MTKIDFQILKSKMLYLTFPFCIDLLTYHFFIQIVKQEAYYEKAEGNRIQAVSLPAPRGLILDRENNILVDNYPTFVLSAIPREFENKQDIIPISI